MLLTLEFLPHDASFHLSFYSEAKFESYFPNRPLVQCSPALCIVVS